MSDATLLAPPADAAACRLGAGEDPQKRQQILEGARQVFVSVGFDAASMNDVVRASGVSKSTLYVYFRSKEELFTALIAEERDRYFEEIRRIFVDPGQPAETLTAYGMRLARMLTSNAVMKANRTVIGVADRMPELGRAFYERGPERAIRLLTGYLEASVAAGRLRIPDARLAAMQFMELSMAGLLRPRLFNHVETEPEPAEITRTIESAVTLFMAGYGTGSDGG